MSSVRVLVVDDDEHFRSGLAVFLNSRGYDVVGTVSDAATAAAAYLDTRPDVVLMDAVMPGVDGFAATQQILSSDPSALVLMVTAYQAAEFEERSRLAGAAAFVSKRNAVQELTREIERVLARPT